MHAPYILSADDLGDFSGIGRENPPLWRVLHENSTKEFPEQFEGAIGSIPSKTRVSRQIAPESSPERSAKTLAHSFFVGPFLSPIFLFGETLKGPLVPISRCLCPLGVAILRY